MRRSSERLLGLICLITMFIAWDTGRVQAQSFLSNQIRVVADISTDIDVSEDTSWETLSNQTEVTNTNWQSDYKILETSVPEIMSELSDDVSADAQKELQEEIFGYDQESLNKIALLINKGENNMALIRLNDLDKSEMDDLDDDEMFKFNELRMYLIIKANFNLGKYTKVKELAKTYFKQYGNGEHFYWVYYFLSASLSYKKQPLEFVSLVTEDFFTGLPNRERSNLRRFLIVDALNNEQFLTAFNFLEDDEGNFISGYENWINDIIDAITEVDDIDQILERYQNHVLRNQLYLRKIQLMVRNGEGDQVQELFNSLVENEDISEEQYSGLQEIQDFISIALDTKPYKIGVILPFSHKRFWRLAQDVQDGLELALKDLTLEGTPIELVFKDSALVDSNPGFIKLSFKEQVKEKQRLVKDQVRELVETDHVIAILGPLAKDTSIAAGEAAEKYKIPVISFSKTENIGAGIPYLFRFQRNQLEEAKFIAHYAMDYLNAERFVLFYQSDKKGFSIMQAFGNEVKKRGGKIVGIARINRKQVDFTNSFKSFTGGFRSLSDEEKEELDKTRERPQPVIDFDAMFLPVKTDRLKTILDFSSLFDANKVWKLAGSDINVRENQLLKKTSRLRFVDTFPVSDIKTFLQPFFESHWKYYNYRKNYYPPTSYSIYSYEALELVVKLLNNPQNRSREALKDSIQRLVSFKVLTGIVTTQKSGDLSKELKILKIRGRDTIEVF